MNGPTVSRASSCYKRLKMPEPPNKLTVKERRFIHFYPICNVNASEACRLAGYSPKSARVMGTQLLANPAIQDALADKIEPGSINAKPWGVGSREWVVDQLVYLAQFAMADASKLRTLELIGKSHGMWIERHEDVNITREQDRRGALQQYTYADLMAMKEARDRRVSLEAGTVEGAIVPVD